MLSIKSEAANFINRTLNLSGENAIKEEQLEKYTNRFITTNLYDKESDVIYKIKVNIISKQKKYLLQW